MATPNNSRLSVGPWGVRLTPTAQSSSKPSKAPSKASRNDAGLSLNHVIGTTAESPNSLTTLSSKRLLAFTAGAAAVICTFDQDLNFTQRFYRARPTAIPLNPILAVYGPSTPTSSTASFRARPANRDSIAPAAPFSPSTDYTDSPGGKSWTARERVKAATCVSFSPDGRYLAVGETGYKPRVLIFSTSKESSHDSPLTCLPDHTFGVRCVAFSPNSQYLASLGAANDGFLYIWSINSRNGSASLYASNKCTSNICQIAWMGSNLITVGTRHVKVWRLDGSTTTTPVTTPVKALAGFFSHSQNSNGSHRILHGRNCLLGSMLEGTFTAVAPISRSQAIVCSDSGDVCLLDDSDGCQRLSQVTNVGFFITAASVCPTGELLITGKGVMKCFDLKSFLGTKSSPPSPPPEDSSEGSDNLVVALAPLGQHMVTINDRRVIKLIKPPNPGDCEDLQTALQLPAHGGPVLGVRPLPKNDVLSAAFFTWSADGTILFWAADGVCKRQFNIDLDQPDESDPAPMNELKVVRTLSSEKVMITGDKLGCIRFIDENTGACTFSLKAHVGEITDIAVLESRSLVASCGRDRTVQVFRRTTHGWELQQTLDEHVGAVTGLVFTADGKQLISCSSDRTVVVREGLCRTENGELLTAFVILRTITLKATPTSMALLTDRNDSLFISTIDRNIFKYNLLTGHQMNSFKASDSEGGDAVVLSSLIHLTSVNGSNILAGVSSTDKSLRLYDENGSILGKDWGHTEGITDITIISTKVKPKSNDIIKKCLVTVAVDGTVFIWTFGARQPPKQDLSSSMELMGLNTNKDLLGGKPPLRRVLSQSEMARFRHGSPEQEDTTTPTVPPKRAHRSLEKRTSRFSLAQTPKLDPAPSSYDSGGRPRRPRLNRSPSPPSPHRKSPRVAVHRKSSLDTSMRRGTRPAAATTPVSNPAELANGTDVICRALRSYRRKLAATNDNLPPEMLRELERELTLTVRAVGEKAIRANHAFEETVMAKVLSQYSEKLLEVLGEKLSAQATAASKDPINTEEDTAAAADEKPVFVEERRRTSRSEMSTCTTLHETT
ncbi:WD40 repeat-like protein [Microthyrium microscopicum]|uniref:WD40 repeat-like protein n=1 Tax=Microthyrium microscopicum TaxID=703497 RepID=A0A6A6U9J3_9PEZI|nr:WD40 repeat-like protein [Microthyrium microscopicum]